MTFRIDVDGTVHLLSGVDRVSELDPTRRYDERTTHQRLHQQAFRERVLRAYREHCAVCRLRHAQLLDAAHIIPDADLAAEPRVSNGISLCKLHHAAYDQQLIGVRPDLVVAVHAAILEEHDGPMLEHGLQGIHQTQILVPRRRVWLSDAGALEDRYETFQRAQNS